MTEKLFSHLKLYISSNGSQFPKVQIFFLKVFGLRPFIFINKKRVDGRMKLYGHDKNEINVIFSH
jgi:hypothetical protein